VLSGSVWLDMGRSLRCKVSGRKRPAVGSIALEVVL
jgi:hypothetical protein